MAKQLWDKTIRQHWIIGSGYKISLGQAPMARLMRALVICDGRIHDIDCIGKHLNSPALPFDRSRCKVRMNISLPCGAEKKFLDLTGFKLVLPGGNEDRVLSSCREVGDG